MSDNDERMWLTVTEAAKITGYHAATVRDLARNGAIRVVKAPGGYQIYMPSLWQYIVCAKEKSKGPGTGPRKFKKGS